MYGGHAHPTALASGNLTARHGADSEAAEGMGGAVAHYRWCACAAIGEFAMAREICHWRGRFVTGAGDLLFARENSPSGSLLRPDARSNSNRLSSRTRAQLGAHPMLAVRLLCAIKTVQAIFSCKPHKSFTVLPDKINGII